MYCSSWNKFDCCLYGRCDDVHDTCTYMYMYIVYYAWSVWTLQLFLLMLASRLQGSKDKQRIDPFKMLMDESPTPSPPRPRPDASTTPPKASTPSNHTHSATGAQKQSEKKRTSSMSSHLDNKVHVPEIPKTTKPPRSKSVSQRSATHSSVSSKSASSPTPKTGEGGSGSKKKVASGSGQSLRPNTGLNGGRSSTTSDEPKRKLLSAKR